jgi:hypothetical protein
MRTMRDLVKLSSVLTLALFLVAATATQANAQGSPQRAISWEELKRVQADERAQLENMQKETLRQILEVQKEQLTAMKSETTANANDLLLLSDKFKEERVELARVHSEERAKLAATHAQERKEFQQTQVR